MLSTDHLATNLKYYREKSALTQKEVAERLGYSEKSVSKWEKGGSLPPLPVFFRLAELFHIPSEELLSEERSLRYLLGIDGGGTKTAFALTNETGRHIKSTVKGACNPNDIGMESTLALLKEGICEVCAGIPASRIALFAGIAGGGLASDRVTALRDFFRSFGFLAFDNGSDLENLIALREEDPCVLVIMGTGFITYALDGERRQRVSGWGQLFEEGGSGYALGRDTVIAALRASDHSGAPTRLSDFLAERIGESAESHLTAFYRGGKRYIASFSDLVFTAAEEGDAVACEILERNASFAAKMIDTAAEHLPSHKDRPIPVLFSGGLTRREDILFPLLKKYVKNPALTLKRLSKEPIEGALLRAKRLIDTPIPKGEKTC